MWNLTPRKFKSQLDVHQDIQHQMNGGDSKRDIKEMQKYMYKQRVQTGFIDQLSGW